MPESFFPVKFLSDDDVTYLAELAFFDHEIEALDTPEVAQYLRNGDRTGGEIERHLLHVLKSQKRGDNA